MAWPSFQSEGSRGRSSAASAIATLAIRVALQALASQLFSERRERTAPMSPLASTIAFCRLKARPSTLVVSLGQFANPALKDGAYFQQIIHRPALHKRKPSDRHDADRHTPCRCDARRGGSCRPANGVHEDPHGAREGGGLGSPFGRVGRMARRNELSLMPVISSTVFRRNLASTSTVETACSSTSMGPSCLLIEKHLPPWRIQKYSLRVFYLQKTVPEGRSNVFGVFQVVFEAFADALPSSLRPLGSG